MTPRHEEGWYGKPSVPRFSFLRVLRDLRGGKRERGFEPHRPARPSAATEMLFNHELHQSHEFDRFAFLFPFVSFVVSISFPAGAKQIARNESNLHPWERIGGASATLQVDSFAPNKPNSARPGLQRGRNVQNEPNSRRGRGDAGRGGLSRQTKSIPGEPGFIRPYLAGGGLPIHAKQTQFGSGAGSH